MIKKKKERLECQKLNKGYVKLRTKVIDHYSSFAPESQFQGRK